MRSRLSPLRAIADRSLLANGLGTARSDVDTCYHLEIDFATADGSSV
ncbi:hypothetical protein [Amycolatopsis thermoflava]|nr:hypothetical protein [Amycolatopsis thermoflava]